MMIQEYHFGNMRIGERNIRSDLKIIDGRVESDWWRKEGHSVYVEDVADILSIKPDVLVVGTGDPGRMQVTELLRAALLEARIDLIEQPTAQAIVTFNRLRREGKRVAGAFHLTC